MTRSSETSELYDILARRLANSASAIVSSMSKEAIELALESVGPTDLVQILAQCAFQEPKDEVRPDQRIYPVIDDQLKGKLAKAAGGLLSSKQVLQRWVLLSKTALRRLVQERRLFVVRHAGRQKYPAFQFEVGPATDALLALLRANPKADGWQILQYLYTSDDGQVSDKPINLVGR